MNLRDKILKLKQEINSLGQSTPLNYVNLDFIDKIIFEADTNAFFKESLEIITDYTDKCLADYEDYNSIIGLKNHYSEILIFSKLKSLLDISKIPERDSKTPDYEVNFRGEKLFIELKSLNMLGGNLKHKHIMEKSLESKSELENMYAGKSGVFSSIGPIIQPYYTDRKDYDPSSTKLVIESLIDKINQNIKEDQYSLGNTILLVDFSDQLLLVSDVKKSLRKNLHDRALGFEYSGELWHVALGELDMPLTKPSQFLDENANDGILEKAGILKDHNYIKGIIFHIEGKFFSIAEIKEDHLNVINLLEYISEDKHFEVPQTINTERPH